MEKFGNLDIPVHSFEWRDGTLHCEGKTSKAPKRVFVPPGIDKLIQPYIFEGCLGSEPERPNFDWLFGPEAQRLFDPMYLYHR